uniref:Retrotransposon protein n=1 Tax=Hypericum perforatum TaxID=65561 RepID=D9ZHD0_HYPPE|nr:retrotransposon protein [Hypericum perforatum]
MGCFELPEGTKRYYKFGSWKVRTLSRAGREIMIKSVLQSISTYIMGCFELPEGTCDRIEKMMCNFYWGGDRNGSKMHWRSWEKLCRSKRNGGLGFRRLKNFNRAMLAKQGWRLLTLPNSLAATILRAKYYPRKSPLEISSSPYSSYTWRSILKGSQLLQKGIEWRIGQGNTVRTWSDPWIPGSDTGLPKYHSPGSDLYTHVSDFIQNGGWNENLLRLCFEEEDVTRILQIRLSLRRPLDMVRWKFIKDGEYTVRSGYYIDFNCWWHENYATPLTHAGEERWKTCWGLRCPPRIKTLLWRLIDNNLSVRTNLTRRGIQVDEVCPCCAGPSETAAHLFFCCPYTLDIWKEVNVQIQVESSENILLAIDSLLNIRDPVEQSRRAATLWIIWRVRNSIVFRTGEEIVICKELEKGFRFWQDFMDTEGNPTVRGAPRTSKWNAPTAGFYKINVDAGLRAERGGQVGIVVRDDTGAFVMATTRSFPNLVHPTLLEGQAVYTGLEFANALGLERVELESDCLPVVMQLSKGYTDRSDLSNIIDDCKMLLSNFQQVRIAHVRREANQAAHEMAKMTIPPDRELLVFSWPPDCICSIIEKEA